MELASNGISAAFWAVTQSKSPLSGDLEGEPWLLPVRAHVHLNLELCEERGCSPGFSMGVGRSGICSAGGRTY